MWSPICDVVELERTEKEKEMIEVKFTDLEEVFERLGNIPVKVSYITTELLGENIVIEAVGTAKRKARLMNGENWGEEE